jgi:S1-C subfamily serine protease
LSIELKERLTDAWERAFPEPPSLGARVAGGFFVAYAVLSAASAWLLVPEAAKGLRVGLFAAALVDALLGLALLAGRERAHRSAALRLALGTLGLCFLARGEPVLIGSQVLLASGFLLLLLGEPDRRRGTAGVLVLLLLLVPLATHVAAPYTQSTPLAELLLELRGGLEPGQVTAARGAGQPSYKLTFPGTGWRQARHEVLQRWPPGVDRAWILPSADATVFVESLYIPAAATVDLDAIVERLQAEGGKAGGTQVEVVDAVALDGPFDAARRLHLREKGSRKRMESLTTLWVRGDHVFEITALAPSHRFPALRAQLAGILDSFSFQPRRTALPEETLEHVRQGTVMVVTPQGSGSGFIFHSAKGASYILTNDHVIRDRQGYPFGVVDVVVQDAQGRRSLRTMASVDGEKADPRADLAVVRLQHLETDTLPVLKLRHSESMRERAPVVAVGYPFGGALAAGAAYPAATVNGGWFFPHLQELKAKGRLVVDVGINPGNSGGPVVDTEGRVVGVAVAHRRGSETSYVISTEAVEKYFKHQYPRQVLHFEDPPPGASSSESDEEPEEHLAEALETRARAATVLVRSGTHSTAGVVVGKSDERALVLASTEVLSRDWKPGRALPPVTVRARPAHPDSPTQPAEVLLASAQVLLLAVALEAEAVQPLELADAGELRTGEVLSVLGFKMSREERLPQVNPAARLETGVLAGLQHDEENALEFLQVDLGINHSQTGGPVFDMSGALVGLAVARVPGTNISFASSCAAASVTRRGSWCATSRGAARCRRGWWWRIRSDRWSRCRCAWGRTSRGGRTGMCGTCRPWAPWW